MEKEIAQVIGAVFGLAYRGVLLAAAIKYLST